MTDATDIFIDVYKYVNSEIDFIKSQKAGYNEFTKGRLAVLDTIRAILSKISQQGKREEGSIFLYNGFEYRIDYVYQDGSCAVTFIPQDIKEIFPAEKMAKVFII